MSDIYSRMKIYMFRTVPLPIIRSLFTVHSALVCVIKVCRELSSRNRPSTVQSWSCSKTLYKPVWHIPFLSVLWINSWWWTDELPKTCRVSCRSKFGKLVHPVGFIIKKFVTMHSHMNVKLYMDYSLPVTHYIKLRMSSDSLPHNKQHNISIKKVYWFPHL